MITGTEMRWTDNHCHLGWDSEGGAFRDQPADGASVADVVAEARAVGVERLVTVGTDAERSAEAIAVARRHRGVVWATVGLHPHDAKRGVDELIPILDDPANRAQVVAVGECGLDYYYDHSPRAVQQGAFAAQIALAHERGLALVIHTRDAWDDTFAILDAEGVPQRTVLHCFTGGPDEIRQGLDRGTYVSFSGVVTFRAADDLRAAAALCPLDRVLVETDSPYLAPVPHRGRPNRPALVPLVGAAVAEAMGREVSEVALATWDNATRVYGLA
ncbi:MAG: TatD family hydrolase [Acidimicrobiales bacterium]